MKLLVSVGKKPVQQREIALVKPSLTRQKLFCEIIFLLELCKSERPFRLKKHNKIRVHFCRI